MQSKICSKCTNPAEFVSPAQLCREHWLAWWVADMAPGIREEMLAEARQTLTEISDEALPAVPVRPPE